MPGSSLYDTADLYDLIHPGPWKGEVEFYLRRAAQCGPRLLELACGTGRLTVPLAQAGLQLTGLDSSAAMLARARERAAEAGVAVRLAPGDMRAFAFDVSFDLIFIPANSICHLLTRADVEACLACVRAHLGPAGRFVVDVFTPAPALLKRDPTRWYELNVLTDPSGQQIRLMEQARYDAAAQVCHMIWRLEWEAGRRVDLRLSQRQFFPQELDALLAYNGFVLEAKYGQYADRPFHAHSTQQVVVARLA